MAKYSKEQIIGLLRNLAERLGKNTLSEQDVGSVIPTSALRYHFGNMGNALEAAGLMRVVPGGNFAGRGLLLTDEQLFMALAEVETEIGQLPTMGMCLAKGRYSCKPYTKRWGSWKDVLAYYRTWKSDNNIKLMKIESASPEQPSCHSSHTQSMPSLTTASSPTESRNRKNAPEQFYGEPIDFRGLRHAPINEQGVVFLFAMVSRELGFSIESIQQGFPDCEGKYLFDAKKNLWAKARIEFEYRAMNFNQHGHDPQRCDFIVCWVNDWRDCPIDVIELKSEILKLPRN